MTAFDHFRDMYDVALKPRLLNTLVRDYLPDQNHPFSNPSTVSKVVSLIKTHRLLSESVTTDYYSTDPKQVQAWKSSVTTWVDRVLSLLDTETINVGLESLCWGLLVKSAALIVSRNPTLRGFISYYLFYRHSGVDDVFFSVPKSVFVLYALLLNKSPEDSFLVSVAACVSISDLLARLSGFPKLKKDGSSCAVKVIQPVLKLLSDCSSEAVWEGAVHVLCTIITAFPFSINRHYDSVESAVASKLLLGECSPEMSKKLAHCLASLPKSKADEESWSVMLQKFLVVINDQLNFAFQGLEEENMRNQVTRLLVLPGKNASSPLGGHILAEKSSNRATKRSEQSLMPNVSTLMFGCCDMLTNPYPVKVNVPARLLLSLVERILMVNGSLPQMSLPFMTAKQQEDICSELPLLHMCSLELLAAIIKAMGSQLLPHAGSIVRIIAKYFKRCALPELRIKFYSVTRSLLLSMGVGMALCLVQEVVNNAFADLGTIDNKSGGTLNNSNSQASTGTLILPSHRKRKHSSTTDSSKEHDDGDGLRVEVPKNCPLTPISLRIAALEALEALITVAGSLKSEPWRSKVDNLLIVIAMDSFKEGPACEEISVFQQTELAASPTDLQLAALRALLASFLSFARVRPPHLSQGLDLFCRGKQEIGTKVAEFCAHALLTLEVLIHPRGLPLANSSSSGEAQHDFRDEHVGQHSHTPFSLSRAGQDTIDTDDDLWARWIENANETVVSLPKGTNVEASRDEEPNVHRSSGTKVQEINEIVVAEAATSADVEMRVVDDEMISKSDQPVESAVQSQEPVSYTTSIPVAQAREPVATTIASERVVSDSTLTHIEGSTHMESDQGSSANKGFESGSQSTSLLQRTSDSTMIKESAFKLDGGNSLADEDVFPDIVDEDPDSDSE